MKKYLLNNVLTTCVLLFSVSNTPGQTFNGQRGYWDGGLPLKPTRVIEFDTDEGANMSVDVSPDGETIVFDLLGDLYTIPMVGGRAARLTSGPAVDSVPRFSPDGKRIAFVSDRSGMANIWTIAADGSGPRRVSNYTSLMDPRSPSRIESVSWARDGQSVFAIPRRFRRFGLPDHLWQYEIESGKAHDRTVDMKESIEYGAAVDQNHDSLWFLTAYGNKIQRRNLASGNTEKFEIPGIRYVWNPLASPDGRWLIYRAFRESGPELRLHDIGKGGRFEEDVILTDQANPPDNTSQSAFTPDSRSVIYSSGGKIKRIDLESRKISEIPFTARVRVELGPLVPSPKWEFTGPLIVKQLRSVNATEDGKHVVFSALGKIWIQTAGSKPKRITKSSSREYDPVLSPDGRWIAFVTWSFIDGGKLWKVPVTGGEPVRLTGSKDALGTPRWTPDGSQLVILRVKAERTMGGFPPDESALLRVTSGTGQTTEIAPALDISAYAQHLPLLTISNDGRRVYFIERRSGKPEWVDEATLRSVSLDGTDPRTHAQLKGHDVTAAPSPDGKWLAIHSAFNTYVMPFPEMTKSREPPIIVMKGYHPEPTARQITFEGGGHPMWSADGKWLSWSWANQLFRLPYAEAVSRSGPVRPKVTTIDLTVPRREPKGHLLLTGARIVTMAAAGSPKVAEYKGQAMPTDPKVIERGDVLLEGARIKAVGPAGTLKIPKGTKTVDLAGKTIVPGYIATHEHRIVSGGGGGALVPEQVVKYASFLVNGFTTNQDPWFGYSPMYNDEMVEAGELVGPRWVGGLNGTDLVHAGGGEDIPDYPSAEALVKKHKSSGAYLIKEYGQPHRIQRQWLAIAAAKYGIRLEAEPFDYPNVLGKIFDGWSGIRHGVNVIAAHDLSHLKIHSGTFVELKKPGTAYGLGKPYFSAMLARRFETSKAMATGLNSRIRLIEKASPYEVRPLSREQVLTCGEIRTGWDAGIGTDSLMGYLESHFQLWPMVRPDCLTNAEGLRVLTIGAAREIGMGQDLGSIEPGKMADMVILNSNPLDDIKSTLDIRYIVKTGEVYDSQTLDVLWPTPRKFIMFPWAAKPGETANK